MLESFLVYFILVLHVAVEKFFVSIDEAINPVLQFTQGIEKSDFSRSQCLTTNGKLRSCRDRVDQMPNSNRS